MNIYEYLEEKSGIKADWEAYSYEEIDLPELKGNAELLCRVWDAVNEWLPDNAERFRGVDAATTARIFNETLAVIGSYNEKSDHTPSETAAVCRLYARCFLFIKVYGGSWVLEQTQYVLNNALSAAFTSGEWSGIESGAILDAKPGKGKWKEI